MYLHMYIGIITSKANINAFYEISAKMQKKGIEFIKLRKSVHPLQRP